MTSRAGSLWFVVLVLAGACARSAGRTERAAVATPVQITLVNRRAEPVFVPSTSGCFNEPVTVRSDSGTPVGWQSVSNLCVDVRAGNCAVVGGCGGAGVFRIEPGASISTTWPGTQLRSRTLSAREAPAGCPHYCVEPVPVPPGRYVVTASAWSRCSGECACDVDVAGATCPPLAGLSGEPDLKVEVPMVVPMDRVELVFQ